MVHALSEVWRARKTGGRLIDLRPTMRIRSVELALGGATLFIGEIDSSHTFSDHVDANEALDAALADGVFRREHWATFSIVSDLDTLADLRDFQGNLRRSVMPESLFERIAALTADVETEFLIRIRREMLIASSRKL